MKKIVIMPVVIMALLFTSCAREFSKVYKSDNIDFKYEQAKEYYARGKYQQAIALLQSVVTPLKGRDNAEESLFLLGMAQYGAKDYETASEYFRKYVTSYPRGKYAELSQFYIGQSLYMDTPEPRLDQTPTMAALAAFQSYLDLFPDASMKEEAQRKMMILQDKIVKKEYLSAKLYYNLGSYFGNCTNGGSNYEACIITARNALNDYPYSDLREEFSLLILKSKFELAKQSVEEKKLDRFRDAEDECYGFINEYPDSKERNTAERYLEVCKRYTSGKGD
ncbi:MAG: outer membrane protein assembly factor BamD [Prevotella sp.]|nr:outer membrane protein assembly factor BamD [Prevotella sp.]